MMLVPKPALLVALLLSSVGCVSRVHEVQLEARFDHEGSGVAPVDVGGASASPDTLLALGPTLSLVFIPEGDDALAVREAPSIDAAVVAEIDRYALDVPSTGRRISVHGVPWVEVVTRAGVGWVSAEYTTEFVPSEDFCEAPDVADRVLAELAGAVREVSPDRLAAVVSPTHGLRVRYVRTDEPVRFTREWAASAMEEGQPLEWGVDPESGEIVRGSFSERVGEEIARAISNGEITCNRLVTGAAPYLADLPESDSNLNFVSVHLPATDDLGMGWVTWTVGFSFEDGRTTIATLSRYAWEG